MAFDGEKVCSDEKQLFQYRRKIGFVFQSKGLFIHLTARQNIILPLVNVHEYTKTSAETAADNLLDRFGLSEDKHKFPHELSGGQQQRVDIARACRPAEAGDSEKLFARPETAELAGFLSKVLELNV